MSSFGGLILTNRGKNLQSKAQSGLELKYTRVGVGDGYLGATPILGLNALRNQIKSLNIIKLKSLGNGRAVVGTVLSNQDITEGFYFREIGIFAQDPDLGEILYCYGNAGDLAEYISPGGGPDIIEKSIDVQMIVGNAQNVTAVIDESLIYVTTVNGKTGDVILTAEDIKLSDGSMVEEKLNEVFQSVSDGKATVAEAITDKGVPTSPTATFQNMANNIKAIETDPSIGTTDATAADVLAPKKVVSQGNLLIGTIPVAPTFPNENEAEDTHFYGTDFTSSAKGNNLFMKVPKGYYNGGWLGARVNNLIPSNVKAGIVLVPRLGGTKSLTGTFTSDGTATAAQMLSGVIAYVNGNKITGTIPSKTAQTYTPGTTNQTIAAGQYLNGVQTIAGSANLVAGSIKKGVNIFGVIGTVEQSPSVTTTDLKFNTNWVDGSGIAGITGYSPTTNVYTISNMFFIIRWAYSPGVTVTSTNPFYIRSVSSTTWISTTSWSQGSDNGGRFVIYNASKSALTVTRPTGITGVDDIYRYID